MSRSPLQIKAQLRNCTKWRVCGLLQTLQNLRHSEHLTSGERRSIAECVPNVSAIVEFWNEGNRELGIGGGK